MKKLIVYFLLGLAKISIAQNPGLLISEIHPNPTGTDSCREFVELIATQNINFGTTPYTIIVNNNGVATAAGWIAGGSLSYAFAITSGSVATGQVVYVGGSCMTPTLNQIKVLNVKNVGGDGGIGTANSAGVFGNGGGNADGVAVFNLPVASITSSSVPTDALFWGTAIGTASLNLTDGYQLPISDTYTGGKLTGSSYFAADPSGDIITATGVFNLVTNTWITPRAFTTTTISSITSTSGITFSVMSSPATISFFSNDTTISEASSTATIYARLTATSSAVSSLSLTLSNWSNASASDYSLSATTVSFAAGAPLNSTFPIVITINNDALIESDEYFLLKFSNPINANIGATTLCAVYIRDNDKPTPAPSSALTLSLLASFSNSLSGSNSAEIVAHDPSTQRLYIANSIGNKVDVINFVNPSAPTLISSISTTTYGAINSIAVRNGTVACAIENSINPQDSGRVVFLDMNGVFLNSVKVGPMPDMITFNNAGTRVITANEGEPNNAYTNDPDGSVSIINISGGITSLNQSNVTAITFTSYNGSEAALKAQGIRIFGVSGIASKDFEPEYVAVSKDDSKAWVTLQENNAIVEINLLTNTITSIKSLGTKDATTLNNCMDVSNLTKGINLSNFPVKGFFLPDAIASYTVGGVNYYIIANEGDARAYTGMNEEGRFATLSLDPVKFPNQTDLKNNNVLGRLMCTNKNGDIDNDGDIDSVFCFGSRSFSIWNANTGVMVYDSKDDFERITANTSFSVMFNASNTGATAKDRSDDKGPEPEGVAIGTINGNTYAFIALERIGGVMVYDVSNPLAPVFVTYVNNRNILSNGPDRGAEGIIFIPQLQSPNGMHIVIAANEVSSTLSIWGIPGCTVPLSSSLSVSGGTINCPNSSTISVSQVSGAAYQWYNGSTLIPSATSNTFAPSTNGNYNVSISNGTNCVTSSLSQTINVLPSPTLNITSSTFSICAGGSTTLNVSGASGYTWSTGANTNSISVTPSVNTTYSVTGSNTLGCVSSAVNIVTVIAIPIVTVNSGAICSGNSFTISPSGASTYTYSGGSAIVSPTATSVYTITGSNAGCVGTPVVSNVTVNPLPTITAISSNTDYICAGNNTTLSVNGASSYTWNTGANTSVIVVSPTVNTSYTVSGTNSFNCSSNSIISQSVSPCTDIKVSNLTEPSFFMVYPNPSRGEFTISTFTSSVEVRIYNSIGMKVYEQILKSEDSVISIKGMSPGVYFIEGTIDSKKEIKRLIIVD